MRSISPTAEKPSIFLGDYKIVTEGFVIIHENGRTQVSPNGNFEGPVQIHSVAIKHF